MKNNYYAGTLLRREEGRAEEKGEREGGGDEREERRGRWGEEREDGMRG